MKETETQKAIEAEQILEIYSFESNEWVECDKWEYDRTEEKYRRISALLTSKNKNNMSWSDPCSNCGKHRADCDCGDWNGYKAKRVIKDKIQADAEEWYHTSEGYDKMEAYIAGRSKALDRERELEEALRDLYNAIDSLPNWKKRDTLAQHCDMEKAKQLLNNH